MTEIEIKDLIREKRFTDVGLKFILLAIYFPIGLILIAIRLVLGILIWILGTMLPDVSLTRTILSNLFGVFFGIIVKVNKSYNKKEARVIISNQISPLDHFVVHRVLDCLLPCSTNLYSPLSQAFGVYNIGSTNNIDEIKKQLGLHLSSTSEPLMFQPENHITNGRTLLVFRDWPFSFSNEIQPIYLTVQRPVFDLAVHTVDSNYWTDMFWYLFSPYTVYTLCYLPVAEKGELNDVEFAEQVRQEMARGMKVELCTHSATDVCEWEKRYILEESRSQSSSQQATHNAHNNPELQRMARQVKEVLPMVPLNVIMKDLIRTRNVDITITGILEGHVAYTPETIPSPSSSPTHNAVLPSTSSPATSSREVTGKDFSTAAPTFPKSAQERMQSFQERKLQLIMNARKRYIDKHGLSALASNDC